jgi:serine/threonine-protein kinase
MFIKTAQCEMLRIERPILAASTGPDLTGPDLVAAVSNAGGFNSRAPRQECQETLERPTRGCLAPGEESTLDAVDVGRGPNPQEVKESGDKPGAARDDDTEEAAGLDEWVDINTSRTDAGAGDAGQASPDPGAALPARWPVVRGYHILEWLGEGGMGVVYKARHLGLNRTVALKMIRGGSQARADSFVRFRAEAETVGRLRHPNIIQIYDIGEAGGLPFVALELLDGGSLADRLGGNPQTGRQAAELMVTLAAAVRVAHEAGIIHRDLKPANVLYTSDGVARITDFGLAKRIDSDDGQTQSGQIIGSPSYMAPEQALGHSRDVGPAADVYALGAILYEMLTGRPPFKGATPMETVRQVIDDDPVTPSRLVPRVSRDLETICLKCLHKEPERRYASAAALVDDLNRFREGRPIRARPQSPAGRLWRWARRKPTTVGLLAALLALFILTVGGGLWLERQQVERQWRAREAVEAALAQLPGLRREGRWPEAEAVLAQGRSRLDEARSDDLRRRLARADDDLRLAAALERIRLTPAMEASRFDYRGMAEAYTRAFEHAGLDIMGDEEAVAARIGASDLRPQLVMALDHWAYVADALGDRRLMARLLGLAQRIDPDPRWGDRFRAPTLWGDEEALRRLAAEAQERLAREAPESGPPTPLVTLVAKKLGQKNGQAEPLLRAARGRHPDDFWLNYALGEALRERKPAESVGFYRAALATRPTVAGVQFEVGMALWRQGQVDDALAEFRRAVELDPKWAPVRYQLGMCWQVIGRLEEALAEYRRVIDLDPGAGLGHETLAEALLRSGRFTEARTAIRRALDVLPAEQPSRPALREKLELCERMLALDARRPALLEGKDRPAAAEQLDLARLCQDHGRPQAAAGLYAAAFASRPALADDLETGDRYHAACAAVRAAADGGPDAARLDGPQRAALRGQGLAWLQADLALWARLMQVGKWPERAPTIWQAEPALASVRDPAALARLPDAERQEWGRFWADVAALLAADPLVQGRSLAASRQWDHAAVGYARSLTRGQTDDGHFWFEYAALSLLSGDRPGYVRTCARMIERCGKAGGPRAYHVARACTLAPDAVAEASLPGRLAVQELKDSGRDFWSLTEQGALAFRAGRFQQAVSFFEQSVRADPRPGGAVLNWLWLSLAQRRLGKAEEARRWLNMAQAWLDQYRDGIPARAEEELGLHLHNWLEAHVLRREAEALIQSEAP